MNKNEPILIACEESGIVTKSFIDNGFTNVFSCDMLETSGKYLDRHIVGDVLPILNGRCSFKTSDGVHHKIDTKFSLIIAFPPCTYLTNAGTRHFSRRINPEEKVLAREKLREEAFKFFMLFVNADCEKIAIENPVGYVNSHYRKPNQIIHPYYFGDNAKKRTCLWLKGLPELEHTDLLSEPEPKYICQGELCKGKKIGWCEGIKGTTGGQKGRAKARSKTFPGIAKAMVEQWTREEE